MINPGRVAYINVSKGGVPKVHVPSARITHNGLDGDRQRNLRYHGGPERAVSIYSLERILALQIEGHPIYPGSTGENLTLSEIDWAEMVPGRVLELGDVTMVLTSYTKPCKTIRESFVDHRISRISEKVFPSWSRLYGRVTREGVISVGDPVTLLPI